MAASDYLLCERCGRKAVYDSDWYERLFDYDDPDGPPVIECAALCRECTKTHRLAVTPREPEGSADGR